MKRKLLVCAPNWLGDCIMAMPAVQRLAREPCEASIAVLTRPHLAPLWSMLPCIDGVWTVGRTRHGTAEVVRRLKNASFDAALVVPNSFRSAWVPFLARVPRRRGTAGHWRRWLLTEVAPLPPRGVLTHQAVETAHILAVSDPSQVGDERVTLALPESADRDCDALLEGCEGFVALFPGAARGVSKQWPARHFVTVGQWLSREKGLAVVLNGTEADRKLCADIADAIGTGARSVAGQTPLPVLAALLRRACCALANDSGGMHLAAAVGTRVVALFGLTDPRITGPLGQGHVVIQAPAAQVRGRDVPRRSAAAAALLEHIDPSTVKEALGSLPGVS